jgi:hypothetical protein
MTKGRFWFFGDNNTKLFEKPKKAFTQACRQIFPSRGKNTKCFFEKNGRSIYLNSPDLKTNIYN